MFGKKDINTEENLISSPNKFLDNTTYTTNKPTTTRWNFLESFFLLLQPLQQLQSPTLVTIESAYATNSQPTTVADTLIPLLVTWPEQHHCDEKLGTCNLVVALLSLTGLNSMLILSIHTLNNMHLPILVFLQPLLTRNFKISFLIWLLMIGICFFLHLELKSTNG